MRKNVIDSYLNTNGSARIDIPCTPINGPYDHSIQNISAKLNLYLYKQYSRSRAVKLEHHFHEMEILSTVKELKVSSG